MQGVNFATCDRRWKVPLSKAPKISSRCRLALHGDMVADIALDEIADAFSSSCPLSFGGRIVAQLHARKHGLCFTARLIRIKLSQVTNHNASLARRAAAANAIFDEP